MRNVLQVLLVALAGLVKLSMKTRILGFKSSHFFDK